MSTPFKFDCNVGQLIQMMDAGKINYDGAVQRGYVWDKKRKSRLIRSIILGRAIGMLNFNQVEKKVYEALDGKQRSNAIYEFIKGEYALFANLPPIVDDDGNTVDIAKHRFESLSKALQEKIRSYGLVIYCYDNLSIDEKKEIFEDINNGKSVTASEKTRIGVKSREIFQSLAKHPAIENSLNNISKKKNIGEDLLYQMWSICYNDNNSLLNQHLASTLATNVVTEKQQAELSKILDYLAILLIHANSDKKILRKVKSKTHIISLAYMAYLAIKKEMSGDEFAQKVMEFFTCEGNKATISKEYNLAVSSGSAKAEQVRIRKCEIEKALM